MDGATLKQLFWNLIGDELDETLTYQLLTQAKNDIERLYKPKILEALDSSQTASPGDTYLTMKDLPTDWRETISLYVGDYPYYPRPFSQRRGFRNLPRRYFIDHKNLQYSLSGQVGTGQTIYHTFIEKTDDLTVDNEDSVIITWPSEFHPLVAWEAAKVNLGGIDPDDIAIRQAQFSAAQYQKILDGFLAWDQNLKIGELGGALGYAPEVDEQIEDFDLGRM